ncbi:hypothetical protein ABTG52_14975, partial [Acinetobacter baumannii]
MDFWSSSSSTAAGVDSFTGSELMEALEPFMKSASSTPPSSYSQLPSPSSSYDSYYPSSSSNITCVDHSPSSTSTSYPCDSYNHQFDVESTPMYQIPAQNFSYSYVP